jgi:hypothetical protein
MACLNLCKDHDPTADGESDNDVATCPVMAWAVRRFFMEGRQSNHTAATFKRNPKP